jgi:hypothetical protein
MSTARERLVRKLEDKKQAKLGLPPRPPKKTSIVPVFSSDKGDTIKEIQIIQEPEFYIIINQNQYFKNIDFTSFYTSEKYRKEHIRKMVKSQSDSVKNMTDEERLGRKREIVIALHEKWYEQFYGSLPVIEYSDRGAFTGARILPFFNHTVIILDRPEVDKLQMKIDYLCLNWLRWFEKNVAPQEEGVDIVISKHSLQLFFCSMVAYDFYDFILEDEYMMSLTPDFNTKDILVVSRTLGQVYLPNEDLLKLVGREYVVPIAYWSQAFEQFDFD